MSAALQPPVGAPPAARASTASHAALPDVQISFEAMLAQTFEPASRARAFAETGILGDNSPKLVREIAAARLPRASLAPLEAVAPTIAAPQRASGVAQIAPGDPSAASLLPQHHTPARAVDRRSLDAPRARIMIQPGAPKAQVQLPVSQLRARASSAPMATVVKRIHQSAFFVALSETASGVRVQARIADLPLVERGRLRQQIHALLAHHGIHSATIEVE